MLPDNLLAEAYRNPEMHLVIMEYATWLKDPVAFLSERGYNEGVDD